jgi:hypothetical protein
MERDINKLNDLALVKSKLEVFGIVFEPGLTDNELSSAEKKFGFKFPPDLRSFLQYALPVKGTKETSRFPNWRDLDNNNLKIHMGGPLHGILFDVEHNNFWLEELGDKPTELEEAKKMMTEAVNKAPRLIPIYSHRFLPSEPLEENNPILSVHQTDIIYYGNNLWKYLEVEFGSEPSQLVIYAGETEEPKKIKFWSKIIEKNSQLIA